MTRGPLPWKTRQERQAFARTLREDGQSWSKIAKACGVTISTVRCWLDPAYAKARRIQNNVNRKLRAGQ